MEQIKIICPICNAFVAEMSSSKIKISETANSNCSHYKIKNGIISFGEGYSDEIAKRNISQGDSNFRVDFEKKLAAYIEKIYLKHNNLKNMGYPNEKYRFLSLGCGLGFDVMEFQKHGFESFGIETSEISDEWLKYHGSRSFRLILSSDGRIPFENNIFHLILSYVVFEHVGTVPPGEIVVEKTKIARYNYILNGIKKLKKGGIFIIITPNKFTPIDIHHSHHYIPYSAFQIKRFGYTITNPFSKFNFLTSIPEIRFICKKINSKIKISYKFLSDPEDIFFSPNYPNLPGRLFELLYNLSPSHLKKYFSYFLYLVIRKE